jgi:hypothetical protein
MRSSMTPNAVAAAKTERMSIQGNGVIKTPNTARPAQMIRSQHEDRTSKPLGRNDHK